MLFGHRYLHSYKADDKRCVYVFEGKTLLKLKPEIYELVCDAKVFLSFART